MPQHQIPVSHGKRQGNLWRYMDSQMYYNDFPRTAITGFQIHSSNPYDNINIIYYINNKFYCNLKKVYGLEILAQICSGLSARLSLDTELIMSFSLFY